MKIWAPVVLLLCSLAGRAFAGDKATAEAAFQQGKTLMKAGKYTDACSAFEKSQALDPQLGTEYNLATCYEKAGRLASAWGEFRELAQRDSNAARKADSEKHATALQPRLIKLLISVRTPVVGLKVTRNGDDVSQSIGIESPVDPGDYQIGAVADGYKPWSVTVSAKQEGGTVQVTVPELEKTPEPTKPISDHDAEPRPPSPRDDVTTTAPPLKRSRKTLGLIVGGGGLAVTAGGLVFGALASSKWSNVKKVCGEDPTNNCMASGDALTTAHNDQKSAATFGNVSTVLVGVGAAALVTGIVLYLTSPSSSGDEHASLQWIPTATPDGFAVTATGRF